MSRDTFYSITFNPGAYKALYSVLQYDGSPLNPLDPSYGRDLRGSDGHKQFNIAPGRYVIAISPGASFVFAISAEGVVTVENAVALSLTGTTIEFNAADIVVDPREYHGLTMVTGAESNVVNHSREVRVLRNLIASDPSAGYIMELAPSCNFRFNIDAKGAPEPHPAYARSAAFHGKEMRFNTCWVEIAPQNYNGPWTIRNAETQPSAGARRVRLVPGVLGYLIDVKVGINGRFDISGSGEPTGVVEVKDGADRWVFHLSAVKAGQPGTLGPKSGPNP